jgi:RsiW-degrading membrane proteinase PrsW (M82 family)
MFCTRCGKPNNDNALFCTECGNSLRAGSAGAAQNVSNPVNNLGNQPGTAAGIGSSIKNEYNTFSEYVGADKNIRLKFSDLFKDVFKKHTREERDKIFMAGLAGDQASTIPDALSWPKPWLYSKFFTILLSTYLLLYVAAGFFENFNMIPGLIFVGSFAVPFTLLVFFWEMNLPRNISFYDLLVIFFIGGVLSLIMTLMLYQIIYTNEVNDYLGAVLVGIIEEAGKIVAVYIFLRKRKTSSILNGILIGAAIGAGFSVFETAGYALRECLGQLLNDNPGYISATNDIIVLRGFLSGGGHISWAAISGGAMVLTSPDSCRSTAMLKNGKCWVLFSIPVVLHAIWDMPIYFLSEIFFVQIVLTIAALITIITLLRSGFTQFFRHGTGYTQPGINIGSI